MRHGGIVKQERNILLAVLLGIYAIGSLGPVSMSIAAEVTEITNECLTCHEFTHPGIVESWKKSRHARTSPAEAVKKPKLERRVSSNTIPDGLQNRVVGCYECHSLRTDQHKDSFEHNGYTIQIVVSPDDCAVCHAEERRQYQDNTMAFAHANLVDNALYQDLITSINGTYTKEDQALVVKAPNAQTNDEACLYCHGTAVTVQGTKTKETDFGEMSFPALTGWPNQGVGRINPDGSKGACTPCHTRHEFSITMARKPATCSECHVGPDVPAYKVYQASKHGNIYAASQSEWDFDAVPWRIGKDFSAPTCAACHASLLVDATGEMLVERSHSYRDRLPWRIFGLIYAHPHAASPDLSIIKNSAGIPLPTELSGEPVSAYLINEAEQVERKDQMQRACHACHSSQWVDGHWARFENTIATTNSMTRTGTHIMATIWEKGYAQGLLQQQSIFDEAVERTWSSLWLYYANTVRFASAMAGGGDYGVFANGRYFMSGVVLELKDWLDARERLETEKPKEVQN